MGLSDKTYFRGDDFEISIYKSKIIETPAILYITMSATCTIKNDPITAQKKLAIIKPIINSLRISFAL